ncbi:protein of unknown function [Taphrina deformans PYCC 5710]|uniref:RRM domain-containing protein n=1 Tax=Taphrina deformans (strain PYCC 5710 / ATCC 11124 / CBS 356.35 / IMI 108563 / JCM 9778 / NBRC 8474) TaxID=1097556 RepID=R4XBR3_TAPDE|nr:protein of unknown function [Taphrina deformans PYCC 5710]|eukprot:CCG80773.1 protein of unknown function [Taphrina deformans PYCC 5710]
MGQRREKSLHERIDPRTKRSPIVFPGRTKDAGPNQNPALKGNPLYAYLNGQKPAPKPSNTSHKVPASKPEGRPPRRNDTHAPLRLPRNAEPEVQIRGSGTQMNVFSIRGASSTSISIKNLAPGTTQADICTILNEQVGEVEDCKTFHVSGGLSTTAEVRFGSRIAADKAINILNGVLADSKSKWCHARLDG